MFGSMENNAYLCGKFWKTKKINNTMGKGVKPQRINVVDSHYHSSRLDDTGLGDYPPIPPV